MDTPIDRIRNYFKAFEDRVDNYVSHKNDLEKCKDLCESAYEGLYKLKERVYTEFTNRQGSNLTKPQITLLEKMFKDEFLIGLLKIRNAATHIIIDKNHKADDITLYTTSNEQFTLDCKTSAGALFSKNIFTTKDNKSGANKIDHAGFLTEAVKRLRKKINALT